MIEVVSYEQIPETTVGMKIYVPKTDLPAFKQLIQRGAQTWADAPVSVKELADMVTNGELLQDYANRSEGAAK